MKNKLVGLVLIGLILSFNVIALADETNNDKMQSEQSIDNNQTYFTNTFEKTPTDCNATQKVKNHFTFFTNTTIINGKTQIVIPTDEQFEIIKGIIKARN